MVMRADAAGVQNHFRGHRRLALGRKSDLEVFDPGTLTVPESSAVYRPGEHDWQADHNETDYHHVVQTPESDTPVASAPPERSTFVAPAFRSVTSPAPASGQIHYPSVPRELEAPDMNNSGVNGALACLRAAYSLTLSLPAPANLVQALE